MFVMIDVRGTGLGAEDFAWRLLEKQGVAVLAADTFGPSAAGHVPDSTVVTKYFSCRKV